jgi:hypothetical protein
MLDAMRGYLHAASGLTELTRKRAQELAQSLISAGGSTAGAGVAAQVSSVAEELISAAKSNRAAVRDMVRGEVEVAVGHLGLVPATELDRAYRKIAKLEATVAELARGAATGGAAAESSGRSGSPVRPRSTAAPTATSARPKRAAVKKAAATRSDVETPAKKAGPTTAVARKGVAKKAAPKKAVAKKATKKAAVKKTAAKKATKSARARSASATSSGAESGS